MKKHILCLSAIALSLYSTGQVVTFNYSDSIKVYTVPPCVDSITIEVSGGQGGYTDFSNGQNGGLGADIKGTFVATPGEKLSILAGGMGIKLTPGSGGFYLSAGGGGGSFVWSTANSNLLIAAGGGGGANSCSYTAGGPGQAVLGGSGLGGPSQCGSGCDNGNGVGGGGAGWKGNGAPSCQPGNVSCPGIAYSPLNGGAGAQPCGDIGNPYWGGPGGFGGGGSGDGNCGGGGGGGGYTGGTGGGNTIICPSNGSQGGTSYNLGVSQNNQGGVHSGNGQVILTLHTLLAVSMSSGNLLCYADNSGTATAKPSCGTGPYTYKWSPGGNTNATATGLSAGTYTVLVTDNLGAKKTDTITVFQPTALAGSASTNDSIICFGDSTNISTTVSGGTPAYTYLWSNGATATTVSVSPATTTTYTCTATDANGCSINSTVTILVNPLPAVTFSGNTSICTGGNTTITASGGANYNWSTGATTNSITVSPATTTTYTVTVSSGSCVTDTAVTVTVNPLPVVTMSAAHDSTCVNWKKDTLIGNPAGGSFTGTGVSGNNFNPNTAGIGLHVVKYNYIDKNTGCSGSASLTLVVNSCTGIQEITDLNSQINLYPDPFTNSVNIDVSITGKVSLDIFNTMGQNVGTWTLKSGSNTINTVNLPTGVYMLKIKTEYGELNKKLIKTQ